MSPRKRRRIGIATGGGDAPGLNAVIRAATLAAIGRGWEMIGLCDSFAALYDSSKTVRLEHESVRGIAHLGGTILGTQSGGDPFRREVRNEDGTVTQVDTIDEAVAGFEELELDGLIVVGGDGTMRLTHRLHQHGVPVVGVPKTIDNDIEGTVVTFGFDTAVSVATDAIDRLHSTAAAHRRVFVVELMGRGAGWIALNAGMASGADVILIPEVPFSWESVFEKIRQREQMGRRHTIVVAAEGATEIGGDVITVQYPGSTKRRLGGIGALAAERIAAGTGKETRSLVVGHLQRGGRPTARDRVLSLRFGGAAVRALEAGDTGTMVSLDPPDVVTVPLADVVTRMKKIPLDSDTLRTARDMGICLGD